jgi:hypothetical protein
VLITYGTGTSGCIQPIPIECVDSITWSDYAGLGQTSMYGGKVGSNTPYLQAFRTVDLPKPNNASRSDGAQTDVKNPELLKGAHPTLVLHSGGNATGSAKLVANTDEQTTHFTDCKHNETTTTHSWGAKPKQGKKPYVLHTDVFGDLKFQDNGNGTVSVTNAK